jgi:hypothetical protein
MSPIDPGRLPLGPILEEAHRRERDSEARAELHFHLQPDDDEDPSAPPRGVRGALRRFRHALKRPR